MLLIVERSSFFGTVALICELNEDLIGCTGFDVVDCDVVGGRDDLRWCCHLRRPSICHTDLSTKEEDASGGWNSL